jgi:D-alanyl-D-alanine carboxypeptidase/D-alanyl-D-alanine-endopeptidase (penicillin-binding protein 4)
VVGTVATRLGLPVDTSVVVDGSGLSLDNRQSCVVFQTILDAAGPSSAIADGLAVAGETGTLARRFLDSPVTGRLRAKTGTLNLVTALAGYLDTTPGAQLSFTFMVNLLEPDRVDLADLALQDDLVAALATYPEGPSLDELGPRPVAVTEDSVGG